jgi:hypothetical protein
LVVPFPQAPSKGGFYPNGGREQGPNGDIDQEQLWRAGRGMLDLAWGLCHNTVRQGGR